MPPRASRCSSSRHGSFLIRGEANDFTADVVRVKVGGHWHDLAKEGRQAHDNPAMKRVV
jgi:hypothetical protein